MHACLWVMSSNVEREQQQQQQQQARQVRLAVRDRRLVRGHWQPRPCEQHVHRHRPREPELGAAVWPHSPWPARWPLLRRRSALGSSRRLHGPHRNPIPPPQHKLGTPPAHHEHQLRSLRLRRLPQRRLHHNHRPNHATQNPPPQTAATASLPKLSEHRPHRRSHLVRRVRQRLCSAPPQQRLLRRTRCRCFRDDGSGANYTRFGGAARDGVPEFPRGRAGPIGVHAVRDGGQGVSGMRGVQRCEFVA